MIDWKNKRILIAEDEISNFMYVSELLEETNIQITHAFNGKKALELSLKDYFDIILMDIKMPIMDGLEATTEIRKINNKVPIIAQTAYAYKREQCIEIGFTDYISKPFNEEQLFDILSLYI
jgi:CheY-like chemotaxis protein